ncbi:hypothetical protein HYN59_13375 [Flavobacterium album]|uniref:Uncharacterized protein n=1 Tax=Flavobacterium album TaxID=2175091 RepID=A0A2S1R053_9FLAO|nr:hypothetical protein [Flavobacterium album]AWH86040.1 hypothetical protein HYN59_13375 [Flavobacterium album]
MEDTFPFSQTEKIEVISYPERNYWDTLRRGPRDGMGLVVENKKFVLDSSYIKERVFLDDKFKKLVFDLLFIKKRKEECTAAACFIPRHTILFYNKKMEIIADIEVCLECGTSYGSFKYNSMCSEGTEHLKEIFKQAGIKYFGD